MELYHVNVQGSGQVGISVEVPNNDTSLIKQRYEVNQLNMTAEFDPELLEFTLDKAIGGTFNLSIYRIDPDTLEVLYRM